MVLNTVKCNYLTPLHFKGLNNNKYILCALSQRKLDELIPHPPKRPTWHCHHHQSSYLY